MRKQVVFGASDDEVLQRANEQENFSAYVKELIRQDTKNKQSVKRYVAASRGEPKLYTAIK